MKDCNAKKDEEITATGSVRGLKFRLKAALPARTASQTHCEPGQQEDDQENQQMRLALFVACHGLSFSL